jgi:hypothetical protein
MLEGRSDNGAGQVEVSQAVMFESDGGAAFVLVVDDDPDVGDRIVRELRAHGCRAVGVDDLEVAYQLCAGADPAVVVIDQIIETPESMGFLRRLEDLPTGPPVVLLRYSRGPVGPFQNLQVTVVGGEAWFEELPEVVGRHVYARAY